MLLNLRYADRSIPQSLSLHKQLTSSEYVKHATRI